MVARKWMPMVLLVFAVLACLSGLGAQSPPDDDPAFVDRLRTSLRPQGRIVFEHFVDDPAHPRPTAMHALKPGQLRQRFAGFRLDRYEEVVGLGEWGGPDSNLVRMVAVKQ